MQKMGLSLLLLGSLVAASSMEQFEEVVFRVADMVENQAFHKLAKRHGLELMNVTWEDTGRTTGSVWGPNISDATIQVPVLASDEEFEESESGVEGHSFAIKSEQPSEKRFQLELMPIFRKNNFEDETFDIPMNEIKLLVGNEKMASREEVESREVELDTISLSEYLKNISRYLTKGEQLRASGQVESLLSARDSHVLVSAQMAYLPVPEKGHADFNPVLFNYQSCAENPAVLAVVATSEGTSATVIDNERDSFEGLDGGWGQRLFHNKGGGRASLRGKRAERIGGKANASSPKNGKASSGKDVVMIIQVPLAQKEPCFEADEFLPEMPEEIGEDKPEQVENEAAEITHGEIEGPFVEIDEGVTIQRDHRLPVRVTIQYYRATETGVPTETEVRDFRRKLGKLRDSADFVGSLVTDGPVGRPTEHEITCYDQPWWSHWEEREIPKKFMKKHQFDKSEVLKRIETMYGYGFWHYHVCETPESFDTAIEHIFSDRMIRNSPL